MEFLIEVLLDLILEGSIEISSNKKISRAIRYPLILFIVLFFLIIVLGVFILGVVLLKENFFGGIVLILISLFLLIMGIMKFREIYLDKYN